LAPVRNLSGEYKGSCDFGSDDIFLVLAKQKAKLQMTGNVRQKTYNQVKACKCMLCTACIYNYNKLTFINISSRHHRRCRFDAATYAVLKVCHWEPSKRLIFFVLF